MVRRVDGARDREADGAAATLEGLRAELRLQPQEARPAGTHVFPFILGFQRVLRRNALDDPIDVLGRRGLVAVTRLRRGETDLGVRR